MFDVYRAKRALKIRRTALIAQHLRMGMIERDAIATADFLLAKESAEVGAALLHEEGVKSITTYRGCGCADAYYGMY